VCEKCRTKRSFPKPAVTISIKRAFSIGLFNEVSNAVSISAENPQRSAGDCLSGTIEMQTQDRQRHESRFESGSGPLICDIAFEASNRIIEFVPKTKNPEYVQAANHGEKAVELSRSLPRDWWEQGETHELDPREGIRKTRERKIRIPTERAAVFLFPTRTFGTSQPMHRMPYTRPIRRVSCSGVTFDFCIRASSEQLPIVPVSSLMELGESRLGTRENSGSSRDSLIASRMPASTPCTVRPPQGWLLLTRLLATSMIRDAPACAPMRSAHDCGPRL
jgi:hypothetical protein